MESAVAKTSAIILLKGTATRSRAKRSGHGLAHVGVDHGGTMDGIGLDLAFLVYFQDGCATSTSSKSESQSHSVATILLVGLAPIGPSSMAAGTVSEIGPARQPSRRPLEKGTISGLVFQKRRGCGHSPRIAEGRLDVSSADQGPSTLLTTPSSDYPSTRLVLSRASRVFATKQTSEATSRSPSQAVTNGPATCVVGLVTTALASQQPAASGQPTRPKI